MCMKKIFLILALLVGGTATFVTKTYAAQEDPEICVPGIPCAYEGKAVAENGAYINVQVYVTGGQYVVRFKWNEKVHEAYAIKCGPCKYYFNWDSRKYYFEM